MKIFALIFLTCNTLLLNTTNAHELRNLVGPGGVGPAWTRGEAEKPAGEKDMGSYKVLIYTPEQQKRLNVNEFGHKLTATPEIQSLTFLDGPGGIGPAWTRGEMEMPAGEKDMGSYKIAVYTPEQQKRLKVTAEGDNFMPAPELLRSSAMVGPGGVGPAWTRGEMEKPAGEKDMGSWKALVYTPEQMLRLGVTEEGFSAEPQILRATLIGGPGGIGPAWTRGEMEKPAAEKDMGTWKALVYTQEQMKRLNVNEFGHKLATAPVIGGSAGIGPAWTRGEMEKPAAEKDMGSWKALVYTPEQMKRLNVNEFGTKLADTSELNLKFLSKQSRSDLIKWALTAEAHERKVNNIHLFGGLHDYIERLSDAEIINMLTEKVKTFKELYNVEKLNALAKEYGINYESKTLKFLQ